jgi:hypothetical protein
MEERADTDIKLIAAFTAELLAAMERHRQERETLSWPEWFAAVHGVDLNNPPYADGRHLKPGAEARHGRASTPGC